MKDLECHVKRDGITRCAASHMAFYFIHPILTDYLINDIILTIMGYGEIIPEEER